MDVCWGRASCFMFYNGRIPAADGQQAPGGLDAAGRSGSGGGFWAHRRAPDGLEFRVAQPGPGHMVRGLLLTMNPHGYWEATYGTYSYSPAARDADRHSQAGCHAVKEGPTREVVAAGRASGRAAGTSGAQAGPGGAAWTRGGRLVVRSWKGRGPRGHPSVRAVSCAGA